MIAHDRGPLLVYGGPGTGKTSLPRRLACAPGSRRGADPAPDPGADLRSPRRQRTAQPDRGDSLATAPGRSPPSRWCAPSTPTRSACSAGPPPSVGEPPPRLLTGPEQDLVIRELLAAGDAGRLAGRRCNRRWHSRVRDPVARPAAARRRAGHQRDRAGRARAVPTAAPTGRGGARSWPNTTRCWRCATRPAEPGVGYDNAEIVRAAVGVAAIATRHLLAAERAAALAFVYVDEFADTDPAQVDLLHLVAVAARNLVAFADPDSSTFGFRGADPRGVAEFPERFTDGRRRPRRSSTLSIDLPAGRAAAGGDAPDRRPGCAARAGTGRMVAAPRSGRPATSRCTRSAPSASESAYVAHRLREAHLLDGVPWDRMAVIVKSTALRLPSLRRALHQAGVPTETLVRRSAARLATGGRRRCCCALRCALDAGAARRGGRGRAAALADRRRRSAGRAPAAPGAADARGRRRDRRPSGDLLVEALCSTRSS